MGRGRAAGRGACSCACAMPEPDPPEQPSDAAATTAGVLVLVGLARARPLPGAFGQFRPGRGTRSALDGVRATAQVAGNLPQPAPMDEQPVHDRVRPPGAGSGAGSGPATETKAGSSRQARWG